MKIISKIIKTDNKEYYKKYLEILNIAFLKNVKLSQKEIEVLSTFMCQDENLISEDMFNPIVRKKAMKELNMKPGGLSNHLKSLIDKGFLVKNNITKRIKAKEFLYPEENNQGFRIKLIKENVDVVKE